MATVDVAWTTVRGPAGAPVAGAPAARRPNTVVRISTGIENAVAIGVLGSMVIVPVIEVVGRAAVGRGIPGAIVVVQHLTLWIALLGAALAARADRLLAVSTMRLLPARWTGAVHIFTSGVAAGITVCLLLASLDLVRIEREAAATVAWEIPAWMVLAVLPVGFAAIAGRLLWHAAPTPRGRWIATLGVVVPLAFGAFPSLAHVPGIVLLSGLAIVAATALGMPIFAAIGGAALLLLWADGTPVNAVPGETYRLTTSTMLPAIPLFALGGYILSEGGSSHRLTRLFPALFGWMPGGLAIVTTGVLAFFTPLTGASGITIVSMGGLLLPVLQEARYPTRTSLGLVTVSGSVGLLFFPSLPVFLYGFYANVPFERLFIGGLLPGTLLVAVVAAFAAARGWHSGATRSRFEIHEAAAAVWEAKWEIGLPVVILGSILGGWATLVEAAAITVLYALIVECVIHRALSTSHDLPRLMVDCATLIGGFMIILSVALGLTNYLILAEVPTLLLQWVQTHIQSPIVFLLALKVLLIIVGALMDIYSAIVVVVPLITPLAAAYGIDPVHLGIIFLANMELGYLMPPMGENLFLSSMRFEKPLSRIYVSTLPYVVMISAAVLIITYVPGLTLNLWKLLGN